MASCVSSEAEAIRDAIKAEMLERDTEELTAGQYIIRWTSIISNRFDTTSFKKNGTGGLDAKTIARLCAVLDCQPGDLMEYVKE